MDFYINEDYYKYKKYKKLYKSIKLKGGAATNTDINLKIFSWNCMTGGLENNIKLAMNKKTQHKRQDHAELIKYLPNPEKKKMISDHRIRLFEILTELMTDDAESPDIVCLQELNWAEPLTDEAPNPIMEKWIEFSETIDRIYINTFSEKSPGNIIFVKKSIINQEYPVFSDIENNLTPSYFDRPYDNIYDAIMATYPDNIGHQNWAKKQLSYSTLTPDLTDENINTDPTKKPIPVWVYFTYKNTDKHICIYNFHNNIGNIVNTPKDPLRLDGYNISKQISYPPEDITIWAGDFNIDERLLIPPGNYQRYHNEYKSAIDLIWIAFNNRSLDLPTRSNGIYSSSRARSEPALIKKYLDKRKFKSNLLSDHNPLLLNVGTIYQEEVAQQEAVVDTPPSDDQMLRGQTLLQDNDSVEEPEWTEVKKPPKTKSRNRSRK